jgi:hypothetical protein
VLNRIVALALMIALLPCAALAGDLNQAIAKAVREEVQATQQTARHMPKVYKWVGIGLLIDSGLTFVGTAAFYGKNSSSCSNLDTAFGGSSCNSFRKFFYGEAIVAGLAGIAVLGIGATKMQPSVTFRPGGFAVQQRIRF